MRDASEATWWRKTRRRAAIATGGALVLGVLALAAEGGPLVFDLPLATFFAIAVAPIALMVATFVFARRQQRLDRDYDVAEE